MVPDSTSPVPAEAMAGFSNGATPIWPAGSASDSLSTASPASSLRA